MHFNVMANVQHNAQVVMGMQDILFPIESTSTNELHRGKMLCIMHFCMLRHSDQISKVTKHGFSNKSNENEP